MVMVIVFATILHFTKVNMFTTLSFMIDAILHGKNVDSSLITQASTQIDLVNTIILAGMVVFAVITGIIAAHITLVHTKEEFIQRKRFITAVAHELRTPLAVLRTSNEVALYDVHPNSPLKATLIENIEQTKQIANILNNLIVFSRAGTADSLVFEALNPSITLELVVSNLTSFANKNHVTLNSSLALLPEIKANKTALEQAFYHLIKNAIIYSKPEGGTVNIHAYAENSHVVVTISDDGIGMKQKDMRHIFEPFYRINPDSSPSTTGTGLGLALVLEIMKLHEGDITVESIPSVGTVFELRFPVFKPKVAHITNLVKATNSVTYSFTK
jgi:signal transduction histidine kinase